MSLKEGDIFRHLDPIEIKQGSEKSADRKSFDLTFSDKSLQHNESIQTSLKKIERKTKRINHNPDSIPQGIQKYLNDPRIQTISNHSYIEEAFGALADMSLYSENNHGEKVALDPGEVCDHLLELSYTHYQKENDLTLTKQQKEEEIKKLQNEDQKRAETNESSVLEDQKRAETNEIENIKILAQAKQKADLIQSENSEKFQQAQQQTEQSLTIDESKLTNSPLTRTDLTKLITLQRDESLRDEDIFTNDDDKQNLRTYLSDGSFEALKDNLGIIDSIDDLALPDAAQQIPGFADAHSQEFDNTLKIEKYYPKYMKLASKIIDGLPSLYDAESDSPEAHLHPRDLEGRKLIKLYSIPNQDDQPNRFLKSITLHQRYKDLGIDHPSSKENAAKILSYALHNQTKKSIKQTTQQNYLRYVSGLFGSMGDQMDIDPSSISYDESRGMQIPFGIDGHQFQNPLTIHQEITGPKIIDNSGNHIKGKEYTPTIDLGLKTMSDIIGDISLTSVLDANSYEDFQNNLSGFSEEQKSKLESESKSDHVKVERYATKLRVENETRSFAFLDNYDGQNPEDKEKNLNATNEKYQETYSLISKTTKFYSTAENKKLADSIRTLRYAIHTAKILGLSNQLKDPYAQLLLSSRQDNGKDNTDVSSRSHEILNKFTTPSGYINTQDLNLFSQYISTIIQQRNPTLTFSSYLTKRAQTISNTTKNTYNILYTRAAEDATKENDQKQIAQMEAYFMNEIESIESVV